MSIRTTRRCWIGQRLRDLDVTISIVYSEEMENLKVKTDICTRQAWMDMVQLPYELRDRVVNAGVLIVPSQMVAQPTAFMTGTMDLLAFLKSQLGDKVEICIADDDYVEIELNSRTLRLGKFLVVSVLLPVFLNLLSNYIHDRIKEELIPPVQIETLDFQKPTEVSFTIAVEDSTGKKKEFSYEGPAADFKEVSAEIEKLWNEE